MNKASKSKTVKANNKNTASNTVSEIQTSDSNQDIDIDENDSDSMGWNNLCDMVMTSDNSDTSDTDGNEWLNEFYEQNHIILNLYYTKLKILQSKFSKQNQ